MGSLSTASTPTHSFPNISSGNNPYLGELVAAYPPRRSSASVDNGSLEATPSSGEGSSIIFNEESGTISARGRTPRKGIFSKESKLTIVADRILSQMQVHRSTDLAGLLETEEHWTQIVKKHQVSFENKIPTLSILNFKIKAFFIHSMKNEMAFIYKDRKWR